MVTGLVGDGRGLVVRLDEGVEVTSHVGESVGVLVQKRGCGNRIERHSRGDENATFGLTVEAVKNRLRGRRGVVSVLAGERLVTYREEENLNGVGEANVVLLGGVDVTRVESTRGRGLDLLDENVSRGTGHTLTLVIGDDGVVSPHVDSSQVSAHR